MRSTTCSHSKPCVLEGHGLGGRVGVVDRRLVHVAELQAHALAVLEVDGGEQDHGFHLRKLADQGQAQRLALFRVELGAGLVAAGDGGGDRAAVIGRCDHVAGLLCAEMIGVDEIGVQAVIAGGDALRTADARA